MVSQKKRSKWHLLAITMIMVILVLIIWRLNTRTLTITFLKGGKPITDLTMEVVIANAHELMRDDTPELMGKTFKTNQLGQIILPWPSVDDDALVRLYYDGKRRHNISLPIPQARWISFDFSPNYESDMKLTTKRPGFFPGVVRTVVQAKIPDSELPEMTEALSGESPQK